MRPICFGLDFESSLVVDLSASYGLSCLYSSDCRLYDPIDEIVIKMGSRSGVV